MIKAIIIDSNADDRNQLQSCLKAWPEITVVEQLNDLITGIRAIHEHTPQLVFIEIDLPGYSGFRLIEGFSSINFDIIFVTRRTEAAIKAFRAGAVGYLVKPFQAEDLKFPLQRLFQQQNSLLKDKSVSKTEERLMLPALSGFHYLINSQILYLSSEGKHTHVHSSLGKSIIIPKGLRECQELIGESNFIRVHRSFIINLNHIKQYIRGLNSHVVLTNNIRLDVGKQFKEMLDEFTSRVLK